MPEEIIKVTKHTWLDGGVCWFVKKNGEIVSEEITTPMVAIERAKSLASRSGGIFDEDIENTKDLPF